VQETPVEQADTAAGLHGLLVSYCQMEYDEDGNVIIFHMSLHQGAYNSGKPGKLRDYFNSGKLREI